MVIKNFQMIIGRSLRWKIYHMLYDRRQSAQDTISFLAKTGRWN